MQVRSGPSPERVNRLIRLGPIGTTSAFLLRFKMIILPPVYETISTPRIY